MTRFAVILGGRAGEVSGPPVRPLPSPASRGEGGPGTSVEPGRGGGTLEELYRRHAAAVYARCRYLLRDDDAARDATQDVFVRVLRAGVEREGAASPSAFLLRTATNHCLNLLRASRAAWRDELARMGRERTVRTVEPDARELVRALLGCAPLEAQEIAVLYFVDELTQAEIAQETGRSLPTVRKRLREFLAAARGALAEALPSIALPDPEELP